MFATFAWLGASILFSWYVGAFDSYDRVYGSLGAVIGFMTWIWVSVLIVLTGAALNVELDRRRAGVPRAPSEHRLAYRRRLCDIARASTVSG